jgi:TRAP transporter TAXI family solute receptor
MLIPRLSKQKIKWGGAALVILLAIAVWLVVRYVSPAPPRTISMTTGATDGVYHQFGLKYQSYLKANGVVLELQNSNGSVENLARLNAGTPIGLVQGGLGFLSIDPKQAAEETPLRSLGVVSYEPVWIFTHSKDLHGQINDSLSALKGKKIALGVPGSGTRHVAQELLNAYGINEKTAAFVGDTGSVAAQKLVNKEIDLVFLIAAPESMVVQALLKNPQIQLAQLDEVEGITRRLPFLSVVSLKASSVDPMLGIPAQDINLLVTVANLVVRDDMHPALAYLLLEAAREVHKGPTLLNRPIEFPHARATDFPLADEALRYNKDGRPFLQRYLPFWAANFVQRLLLILVPLLAVAFPIFKTIPSLLRWRQENRLFRKYSILLDMEKRLAHRAGQARMSRAEIAEATALLDSIEDDISKTKFALDFSDRVYTLRQHVDYVRAKLSIESQEVNPT